MSVSTSSIGGPSHRKIAIVGAGVAGLTLASLLQKQNIPFSIYEARSANAIGHSYAITLFRRPWRSITNRLSQKYSDFRQETAADRITAGIGKVTDQSPESSATFQAVDRDVRQWLVYRLRENGVEINWDYKLSSISTSEEGSGALLSFENEQKVQADIIIDAGGLRSPAFDYQVTPVPQPKLLPYATYYGSRRMSADDFSKDFAHHFRTGNTIELAPETPTVPFIQLKKVHLPSSNGGSHAVELRWVYSRPAREGSDPLFRPDRSPEEAKIIPNAFYEELQDVMAQQFSNKQRSMLRSFFTLSDLRTDRILNWHLRIRLPELEYFVENFPHSSYQIIAIGDAAHGLPIVESRGAAIAADDASNLARWLQRFVAGGSNNEGDLNYYKRPDIYRNWFKEAVEAVQRLRECHGQTRLSKPELRDTIGFWADGVEETDQRPGSRSSSSEPEDVSQDRGKL